MGCRAKFLKSFAFQNAAGCRKANLLRTSAAGGAANPLFLTVDNIALSLGYSSIYEFSKTFKKHTGLGGVLLRTVTQKSGRLISFSLLS